MTAQEFLFDTVHHYTLENRCLSVGTTCHYSPVFAQKQGLSKGCAIGRHLDPELAYQIDKETEGKDSCIRNIFSRYPLPDWMIALGVDFLFCIQDLHDYGYYWDSEGLSEEGKKQVRGICTDFNLDYEQLKLN